MSDDIESDAAQEKYTAVSLSELQVGSYVQLKFEGDWWSARVTSVSPSRINIEYIADDVRSDTAECKEPGQTEKLDPRRSDAVVAYPLRRPVDETPVDLTDAPTIRHDGETLHEQAMRAVAPYDAAAGTAMGVKLPPTIAGQTRRNLDVTVAAVRDKCGRRYVCTFAGGGTAVLGSSAIAQHLLADVQEQLAEEEDSVGSLVGCEPWQSSTTQLLEPGKYVIIIGSDDAAVVTIDSAHSASVSEMPCDTEVVGFAVQVARSSWLAFHGGKEMATVESKVNGGTTAIACACDVAACRNTKCHRCSQFSGVDLFHVPTALHLGGVDAAVDGATTWSGLPADSKAREAVHAAIEQQFQLFACADSETGIIKGYDGVWRQPTAASVHAALLRSNQQNWLTNCGLGDSGGSSARAIERVNGEILTFLQEKTKHPRIDDTARLTIEYMGLLRKAGWTHKKRRKALEKLTFFAGQRVDAYWTTTSGTRGNAKFKKQWSGRKTHTFKNSYAAAVVGSSETDGYLRLLYDAHGDHPEAENCAVPPKFIRISQ